MDGKGKRMVKGIFFDAAGVFYDRKETTGDLARRRLAELGYATVLSPEKEQRKRELHSLANEGRITHEAYWDDVLAMHGLELELRAKLKQEVLAQTFQVFAYPGGREAMASLQARGFVLGLVTDTIYPLQWKMAWLEQVGVAEFFTFISCSSTLGVHKPQPEMYLDVLRQAALEPAQAAFVGHDSVELEGARRVGMATIAINYDPGAQADYYAESLTDLLNVPILNTPK